MVGWLVADVWGGSFHPADHLFPWQLRFSPRVLSCTVRNWANAVKKITLCYWMKMKHANNLVKHDCVQFK